VEATTKHTTRIQHWAPLSCTGTCDSQAWQTTSSHHGKSGCGALCMEYPQAAGNFQKHSRT